MFLEINDPKAVAVLAAETSPIELRAPDGRLLGQFIPVEPSKRPPTAESGTSGHGKKRQYSDLIQKWYTADEVMERLRQLRKSN